MDAYLMLVTWPDGTECQLFPKPGHSPLAMSEPQGRTAFEIARAHLLDFAAEGGLAPNNDSLVGTTIRLVKFERGPVMAEFTL
jgi:hypothetical protein